MISNHLRLLVAISLALGACSLGQESPADPDSSDGRRTLPERRAAWMARGREGPPGKSAAALRLRAHAQRLAFRHQGKRGAMGAPASSTGWVALGPAPLISDNNLYGLVSGRATSVAIDPSDATGNTVYIGAAYGGVWKSTNATASPAASVTWTPVTDQQASLATGAVSVKPDGSVILAGTGEPDNAIDSYYGVGILRSTDDGATWTLIDTADGGSHPFAGLGAAKFAWSRASGQSNVVVVATATTAKGFQEGNITGNTNRGLYRSADGGQTWAFEAIPDGGPISATDVIYDAIGNRFIAAVRNHGLYTSSDGATWTRMASQPPVLTSSCSAQANCPFYRGQLAVVPGRDELYLWFVNLDSSGHVIDEGIWRSLSGGNWSQISEAGLDNCGDANGCGVTQGTYNLAIAALPDGTGITDLYAGAVNLYKCRLLNSQTVCSTLDANLPSSWLNLTHVYGACSSKAQVHPDEHGMDFAIAGGKAVLYFANDGGIYRALDGYSGLNVGSCNSPGSNAFDDLNGTLGALTQFVSFSTHPTDPETMLGGTQDNGSPGTSAAGSNPEWTTVNGGDGGYNAINPAIASQWFTANTDVSIQMCNSGMGCSTSEFLPVVTNATVGGDAGPFYTPYILDPQNSGAMLVGTCRVWRGGSDGTGFTTLSVNFDVLSNATCTGDEFNLVRGLAAGGPTQSGFSNVVYATTEGSGPNCTGSCGGPFGGEVWVSTNSATTSMANVTGTINPNHYTISSVAMDNSFGSGQTAYLGIMGFLGDSNPHIFKTTDAGQSWSAFGSTLEGLPDAPVNALLVDGNAGLVYAGTDVGVFVSATASPAWSEVGPAAEPGAQGYLPNVPVSAIRVFSSGGAKKLRVSTYGRGIWEYDLATSPDYQLAISNTPLIAFPNQTATFTGTLTSANGYSSAVTLSCGSGAPGACSIPGNPITPADSGAAFTVSMNSGASAANYNFNIHGVGADAGNITHDAAVTLQVVDYKLGAPSPSTVTAQQGGISNTTSFQVTALGAFSGTVTLSCKGSVINAGASCSFSSAQVQPTAGNPATVSLNVSVPAGIAINTYAVTIQAASAGAPAAKTQALTLVVVAPAGDFAIAVNATPNAALSGQTVTWNGTLTALNGYNQAVTLSCTNGRPGTCTPNPASLVPGPGGTAFAVTVGNPSANQFDFTIQATDGTLTHATPTEHLTVNTDVGVPASIADASVEPGQTAITTLDLAPVGGSVFSGPVSYSCSGLPAGLSCMFNPSQLAAGSPQTAVTISIQTAGPFTGTQARIVGGNRRVWIIWSLPLAAFAFLGLARRATKPGIAALGACGALLAVGSLVSCGKIGGEPTPPPPVSVTVKPTIVNTLYPSLNGAPPQTQQFTAIVNNATNQAVDWTVGGGAANGTIDVSGLYTAPATVPAATVSVTATAVTDASKSASAAVNILTPTPAGSSAITVTVTEATQPQAQHTTGFHLTVQ